MLLAVRRLWRTKIVRKQLKELYEERNRGEKVATGREKSKEKFFFENGQANLFALFEFWICKSGTEFAFLCNNFIERFC